MATENMNQLNLQTTDGKSFAFAVVDQEARDLAQQALDAAGSGGTGGDCNIQRIESESSNYVYLRDLASGLYVLYGYFRPFTGSGSRLVYDNVLASVAADDTGSHILTFDTVNSKINFVEVLVDDKQTSGFAYTRTAISLLDLHGLIARVEALEALISAAGINLTDRTTGKAGSVYVDNGKLTMDIEETTEEG